MPFGERHPVRGVGERAVAARNEGERGAVRLPRGVRSNRSPQDAPDGFGGVGPVWGGNQERRVSRNSTRGRAGPLPDEVLEVVRPLPDGVLESTRNQVPEEADPIQQGAAGVPSDERLELIQLRIRRSEAAVTEGLDFAESFPGGYRTARADAAAHSQPGVSAAASGPPARSPAVREGLPETAASKRRPAGEPPQPSLRADDQVSTQAR